MAKSQVGVEITEESVRAVEVSLDRNPHVIAYGEVPLLPDSARDSEVLDEGAVAIAIRQLWSTAGIKAKTATLGVASRRVLVREYTTPVMAPELLRQALPFQVQDLLPVPVSQAVLDYYPTAQDGERMHGLLVAAVADTVEGMMAAFDRAKVRIMNVDLTTFGLARAAARVAPQGTVAVVHIGDHTTQILILRDGIPEFVRITPVDLETNAVVRRRALVASDAGASASDEPAPLQYDAADLLDPARVAASALNAPAASPAPAGSALRGQLRGDLGHRTVTELVGRIRSTLAFYANRPQAPSVDQVLLCGAGSTVRGVTSGLADALPVPIRQIGLGDVAEVRGAEPVGDMALNLVGTLGLALGKAK
ncbi:pilus assembly protein PilM [Microbacterium sp. ARD32]|uniref:type IV pilus biogenesis protein PilM n=1 Tax=Microbacterium sp. ARD32 TaxID=2962577 RepID=UPI002881AA50|nr:pilus assembly protein PilM [Microbacterium sp. ARD32]MDT0158033.1 pilus assembly protein PilM [Microbacterium sp. ARD32]